MAGKLGGGKATMVYYRASKPIMDMYGVRVYFPYMTFKLSSPLKIFEVFFKHLEPNIVEHQLELVPLNIRSSAVCACD
jgi:hypothetical protein